MIDDMDARGQLAMVLRVPIRKIGSHEMDTPQVLQSHVSFMIRSHVYY